MRTSSAPLPAILLLAARNITLTLACVLTLAAIASAAVLPAPADAAPASEEYVLKVPSAGADERTKNGTGSTSQQAEGERSGGVAGVAAGSADDGGLPILLVVLAGTALAGASIAMMRRRRE